MIAASYARLLLAGLCQLTLATSASAEGAWVLWEHSRRETWWGWGSGRIEWTSLGAVATLAECEREQALHTKKGDMLAKVEASSGRMPSYVAWRCLPDTVDPRGPKGK